MKNLSGWSPGIQLRIPGLSRPCFATELQQPNSHQPLQSSICSYCTGGMECLSHGFTPSSSERGLKEFGPFVTIVANLLTVLLLPVAWWVYLQNLVPEHYPASYTIYNLYVCHHMESKPCTVTGAQLSGMREAFFLNKRYFVETYVNRFS